MDREDLMVGLVWIITISMGFVLGGSIVKYSSMNGDESTLLFGIGTYSILFWALYKMN